MLFTSWEFLILVFVTFALYYQGFFRRYQVSLLVISSFFFYAFHNPALLPLLIFATVLISLSSYAAYYSYKSRLLLWAALGVVLSLALLSFFKYGTLLIKTYLYFFKAPNGLTDLLLTIPLPIGISFFVFEGISLIVDSYRHTRADVKPTDLSLDRDLKTHIKNTAFFISFFPHLIAGPIIKAHQFFPQIESKYLKDVDWEYVLKCLVAGYFLKMVIADNLQDQTSWLRYPWFVRYSSFTLIMLAFGYSMQIFADFAGYSLIALGLASLFGYRLPVNFNFPYIAGSFSEFWQRWHMSLSAWLKEYLYIPLGGNRKGNARTYVNIAIVMFLGGLWHGAAWSYAVWGAWHGALLMIERVFHKVFKPADKRHIVLSALNMMLVFVLVSIGWVLFKLSDFTHVMVFFSKMSRNLHVAEDGQTQQIQLNILLFSMPVIVYHALYLLKKNECFKCIYERFEYVVYGVMLTMILLNSGNSDAFIYFQF